MAEFVLIKKVKCDKIFNLFPNRQLTAGKLRLFARFLLHFS